MQALHLVDKNQMCVHLKHRATANEIRPGRPALTELLGHVVV